MVPVNSTVTARSRRSGAILTYGLPGLALGLVLAWVMGLATVPRLQAESAPMPAASSGLMALTTETPGNPNGMLLYLIDARTQSFAIYRVDGLKGTVRFEAARQFSADLKLSEYNNLPPEVAAVEAMVASPRPRGVDRQ